MPVAIITGASKGLGRALGAALAARGWDLVLDARTEAALEATARALGAHGTRVTALAGDVTDPAHRAALVTAARALGGLDLLVNNASALGVEPLVRLAELAPAGLRRALETNVVAPLGLVREALALLRASDAGAVLSVSSDAAVEAYGTWGGYGASKAALDQLSAVLAVEEPGLRVWSVDPGDMRTDLYRRAVPGDAEQELRPLPESAVPGFLRLLDAREPSGRYTAAALAAGAPSTTGAPASGASRTGPPGPGAAGGRTAADDAPHTATGGER